MIIFDLEWNHGYKPRLPDEILQIGAVKVDRHYRHLQRLYPPRGV